MNNLINSESKPKNEDQLILNENSANTYRSIVESLL